MDKLSMAIKNKKKTIILVLSFNISKKKKIKRL